ncbi:homoprotocatechuate degradation operon regulator HpaR [Falsiroseomonas sp. HW251]|uniref:homoprotocatechuate degradation operon regulator HpaR n=1 Tax=Falsiroseomonas sp. HW251 TaxID=3390998 RepID=UPI003D3245F3
MPATQRRVSAPAKVRLRDFSRSLPMSLLRARETVMRHFRAILREANITEQQWRVLRALTSVDEIEVSALARKTFLLAPSLSRILKTLDEQGLIERRFLASDLRRSVITIAPRGSALIDEVAPRSEAIYARIAERFGADRLAQLQQMLAELEQCMLPDAPPAEDDAEPPPASAQPRSRRAK